MVNIIEVRNLLLRIKDHVILQNINLSFQQGQIHGLIGRNGSGKTMLMKCICGFVLPTSGDVFIAGKRIGKDCEFPESIGIIIETPGFLPYLSGYRNLKQLADISGKIGRTEIHQAMERVGLDPDLKRFVKKYSLGMRQRLGIAQAVMEDPDILVLDEPFNGLDKDGVEDMRRYFLSIKNEGKTILLASHNPEDIRLLCDTVHELDKGKIIV